MLASAQRARVKRVASARAASEVETSRPAARGTHKAASRQSAEKRVARQCPRCLGAAAPGPRVSGAMRVESFVQQRPCAPPRLRLGRRGPAAAHLNVLPSNASCEQGQCVGRLTPRARCHRFRARRGTVCCGQGLESGAALPALHASMEAGPLMVLKSMLAYAQQCGRLAHVEAARGPARQRALKAPPRRLGSLRHPLGVRVHGAAVDECDGRRDILLWKPYQGFCSSKI